MGSSAGLGSPRRGPSAAWLLVGVAMGAGAGMPPAARAQGAPPAAGAAAVSADRPAAPEREGCPGCTPLHRAAAAGQADEVTALLAQGADPLAVDAEGDTPLLLAVASDQLAAARALLEHGGGISVDARGRDGWIPLTRATFAAPPGAKKAAPEAERRALIELLLERGADVNARDGRGNTVLHMAVITLSADVVRLLLDHGADRRIRNDQGAAPVELARLVGDRRTVELLE